MLPQQLSAFIPVGLMVFGMTCIGISKLNKEDNPPAATIYSLVGLFAIFVAMGLFLYMMVPYLAPTQ